MHGWTWQREATMRPQRCAVFPHVNNGAFIDTGITLDAWDPHIYISDQAAVEIGKFAGMVPGESLAQAGFALVEEQEKVAALEAKVAELQRYKDAVRIVSEKVEA